MLECRIRYICLFIFYSWLNLEEISRLLQSCTLYSSTFCSYLLFRHLKSCWHNNWPYFLRHNVMGCLNTNNFLFLFFYFSDFILIFFLFSFIFLLDDKEACDTAVTWQVTWYDVIGLEHGGRIWKIISGHMYTT